MLVHKASSEWSQYSTSCQPHFLLPHSSHPSLFFPLSFPPSSLLPSSSLPSLLPLSLPPPSLPPLLPPPSLLPPSSLLLPSQTSSIMRMVQMSIERTKALFFLSGGSSLTEHARWPSPPCAGTHCTRTCLQWDMAPVSLATRGRKLCSPLLSYTHPVTHTHSHAPSHTLTHTQMTSQTRVLVWSVFIHSRTQHTLSEL